MATKTTCDLCGADAVGTIEAKTDKTTALKKDVCEAHLAKYKEIMRVFLKQEFGEIVIEDEEVKVKNNG